MKALSRYKNSLEEVHDIVIHQLTLTIHKEISRVKI